MRKIGLFGGTFNPIHNGHLIIAEQVRSIINLDVVYFIPSFIPPHKTTIHHTHRKSMVEISIKDRCSFYTSLIEINRGAISYTVDTIKEFKSILGDVELFFIIGSDAFLEIHTWERGEDILNLCKFVIINRSAGDYHRIINNSSKLFVDNYRFRSLQIIEPNNLEYVDNNSIPYMNMEPIGISSTQIRRLVKNNKSIRYLVNDDVIDYIREYNLYKEE